MWIGLFWAGLRVAMWITHVGGKFRHGLLELREAKPGGFQTRVFLTFFGKGPDCVADPFGTVPRRCS